MLLLINKWQERKQKLIKLMSKLLKQHYIKKQIYLILTISFQLEKLEIIVFLYHFQTFLPLIS